MNYIYDMVVDTQFNKFHGRPFVRVLYVFLMKDIGRGLPWVLPGWTGRFYKDDVVHNHSAHGYNTTRTERGVRYTCMILLHVKQNKTKLMKKNIQAAAVHAVQQEQYVYVSYHQVSYSIGAIYKYAFSRQTKSDLGSCVVDHERVMNKCSALLAPLTLEKMSGQLF